MFRTTGGSYMMGNYQAYSWVRAHLWTLFFLSLAAIFAIPMLLIVSSPVLHAVGLHDMASAGDNMASSSSGQQAAMGSTAASGTAGAAAAGSSSGSGRGRGRGSGGNDNVSPQTPLTPPKSSGSDDDDSSSGFGRKTGSGKQPGNYDPNKSGSSGSSSGSSGSSGDDSGFFPQWLIDILTGNW